MTAPAPASLGIAGQLRAELAAAWLERAFLDMCEPCLEDLCCACQGGRCRCACQDYDPPPPAVLDVRETASRCDGCGYLTSAPGHKLICGSAA